ncbi:MAG TPA: polysaccharide biosynthesis protein [Bacillales bacterium]|nr:polysaccharide biosynthesis protein [Bacillales bacterium]
MPQSRLLRGTFILSAAIFLSKFLGLIFVIPLNAIVGPKGLALYAYAYIPYTIILSVATLGVPMAVSKFVSKYNAIGDYHTGRRLFRSGLLLMSLTGVAAFLILYLLAPEIAPLVVKSNPSSGNDPADVIMVIRLVSTALIVVPVMSLMRGYFQGFESMGPTAVSQVVEQILRILFGLIGAIFVVFVFNGSYSTAVGYVTFGAFIGALGGLAVLVRYWLQRKPHLNQLIAKSRVNSNVPLKKMYKELIAYAVPFVAVGLAISLYQLVDELTMNKTLMSIGMNQGNADKIFGVLEQNSHKLIMIPVSLSTALAVTLVPTITNSFSSGKYRLMHHQMTQAFQVVLFLTIPAAIGLFVLAYPVFGTLYGIDEIKLGGHILRWYAPTALLFASFSITSSVLQGINQQKFTVFSLLVGLLLKLLLNEWLLTLFQGGVGAILATDIGYFCSVMLNILVIRTYTQYRFTFIAKRALLILIFSVLMAIVVLLVTWPFKIGNPLPETWFGALGIMVIGVVTGGACFFLLAYRSNLAGHILGDRFSFLKRRKGGS